MQTKEKAIQLLKQNKLSHLVYLKQVNYPRFGGSADIYMELKSNNNKQAKRVREVMTANNIFASLTFEYDFYPFNNDT